MADASEKTTPQTDDLAFDLSRQARDRVEEFEAAGRQPTDPQDDDRLAPTSGEQAQEHARLRQSAEIAEKAYRLADGTQD